MRSPIPVDRANANGPRQLPEPVATAAVAGHRAKAQLWLVAALLFEALSAARAMAPAFGPGDRFQGNTLNWVFWIARFRDPELLRDDLITDYFQWQSPPGYSALYWVLSQAVDPLLASKLLPPLLGLVAALFTYLLVRRLHPAPQAAFLATVLLSWFSWQRGDLASASPRAYALPLLAALLWSLAAGRRVLPAALVMITALFYQPAALLGVTLLGVRLIDFRGPWPIPRRDRSTWLTFIAASALAAAVILPGQSQDPRFGPLVTADQARAMSEFGPGGRFVFFVDDPYEYFVTSRSSGLSFQAIELLLVAALLPIAALLARRIRRVDRPAGQGVVLFQLLIASFVLFSLAHLLLFRLYLPNRYVRWSLPLVLAVAGGLALGILIQASCVRFRGLRRSVLGAGLAMALAAGLAIYPIRRPSFNADNHPALTAFLRNQPKNVLVAGAATNVDTVPLLAQRRVLTSVKLQTSLHLGYITEMRRRTQDLLLAYYAESATEVARFAERYAVDIFVVDPDAFTRRGYRQVWDGTLELDVLAIGRKLQGSSQFALLELARRCGTKYGEVVVVMPACIQDGSLARGDVRSWSDPEWATL
jgi:hypothetical protein